MNKYERLRELAKNNSNLRFIETTDGMNGYPSHLMPALVGFETFDDADKFAQEHGLDTMCFHKRDGWQLWQRCTPAYEPMTISAEDYGDDYNMFTPDDLENYYENEVKPCLEDFDNMDDIKDFLNDEEEIMDELERCHEDEAVITYCGKWYDTIKVKSIEWGHDTHNYVIGVIDLS